MTFNIHGIKSTYMLYAARYHGMNVDDRHACLRIALCVTSRHRLHNRIIWESALNVPSSKHTLIENLWHRSYFQMRRKLVCLYSRYTAPNKQYLCCKTFCSYLCDVIYYLFILLQNDHLEPILHNYTLLQYKALIMCSR